MNGATAPRISLSPRASDPPFADAVEMPQGRRVFSDRRLSFQTDWASFRPSSPLGAIFEVDRSCLDHAATEFFLRVTLREVRIAELVHSNRIPEWRRLIGLPHCEKIA